MNYFKALARFYSWSIETLGFGQGNWDGLSELYNSQNKKLM